MKKLYAVLLLSAISHASFAQQLTYKGGAFSIKSGTTLSVGGTLNLQGSSLQNEGVLELKGNVTNNVSGENFSLGNVRFAGTGPQNIVGSVPVQVGNLNISNPAGLILTNSLRAEGSVTFSSGIITAELPDAPMIFGETSTISGVSDWSHVNGYVVREGNGEFTYPVGDATRYQPVHVELMDNSAGLRARYVPGNAGAGDFSDMGIIPIPLNAYNTQEYWDIAPLETAIGFVTIYWDDYNNDPITSSQYLPVFSVAHKTIAGWMNEGEVASGSISAGSVKSGMLAVWSPFTLGSVSESALPVSLADFAGKISEQKAVLDWRTDREERVSHFDVERSNNGRTFVKLGEVAALGNSSISQNYQFTDHALIHAGPKIYYRLRSVDFDGSFSFSKIISLQNTKADNMAGIFPNPARRTSGVTVRGVGPGDKVTLVNLSGKTIAAPVRHLTDGNALLETAGIPPGMYLVKINSEQLVTSAKLVIE